MAYPSQSTIRSYGGACPPSSLAGTLAASYSAGQTFTLASCAGWYEVSSTGQATSNPLGTSGPFVVTVDFSTATEEKILCSAVNVATGVVTVWTDGSLNGRGYDGTTISAHAIGASPNCFPVASAVENLQLNAGVVSALSSLSSKVSSVTAGDSSITIGGTSTDPTVAVASSGVTAGSYGSNSDIPVFTVDAKGRITTSTTSRILTTNAALTTATTLVTGTLYPCDTTAGAFTVTLPNTSTPGGKLVSVYLKAGTNALTINAASGQTINNTLASIQLLTVNQAVLMSYTAAAATWQIIGGAAIPASATGFVVPTGGDLAGTYPAPTLAAVGTAGTYGSASLVPVITTDSKGRVTGVTNTSIAIPAIAASAQQDLYVKSAVRTSSATITNNEVAFFDTTAGALTCTLPGVPSRGQIVVTLTAGSNPLTISAGSGQTFNGSLSSITLTGAGQSVRLIGYQAGSTYIIAANSSIPMGASGPTATSSIAMGSNQITGLANGTASTDAAAFGQVSVKANSAITISTTAPLSGGGDLSANRTIAIADGTTSVKGAVQLTDSTSSTSTTTAATPNSVKTAYDLANGKVSSVTAANSSITVAGTSTAPTIAITAGGPGAGSLGTTTAQTPQLTLDAYGRVASVTNATINDTSKLPLAGGTMVAGAGLNMNNGRVLVLGAPASSQDAARAGDFNQTVPVYAGYNLYGTHLVTWTFDPVMAYNVASYASNQLYFTAIYIPYTMTVNGVLTIIGTSGTGVTSGNIGLFSATTCLAQTGTGTATAIFQSASGSVITGGFVAGVTVGPGVYWIGHYITFSTVSPILVRSSSQSAAIQNLFYFPQAGTVDSLRVATFGTGSASTYFPATGSNLSSSITPAATDRHTFWAMYS